MCGITGIISANPRLVSADILKQMTNTIAHRGPDGEGYWISPTGHAGLGHRRLAVIDLSAGAAQPMHYLKRYTIVYNGEIYNYPELKEDLIKQGYVFGTRSDTEVILAAYDWRKEQCLSLFDGMFAFAIWDEKEQRLFAARDRFGEKPLYTCIINNAFYFASEIKSFWATGIPRQVNESQLINYLALGYTQGRPVNNSSFYRNVYSLPPGHYLSFEPATLRQSLNRWWQLDIEREAITNEKKAVETFGELLLGSVRRRLRSDVPLGSSLSGGIDSSSIVEMITRENNGAGELSTFSAVFPGFEKDESAYIRLLSAKLRVQNYTVTPTVNGFLADFEKLLYHHDEPIGSASIYAQYKVFELARQHNVTVLLDGQGADEILAGYTKYLHWYLQELLAGRQYARTVKEKKALRENAAPFNWGLKNYLAAWFPEKAAKHLVHREAAKLKANPFIQKDFLNQYADPGLLYKPVVNRLNDLLCFNTCGPGLEELLRNADRNSMAHAREVRLPFLNHQLVEFVFSLPAEFKIRHGWTKWLLRKSMDKKLPDVITWRKDKVGFEPPQQQWMENATLQEYIRGAREKLVAAKIMSPAVLNKKIQPLDAHAADNLDWRCLAAARLIK
jgi:asparagine synthase (glutamine-hydrolysing)